MGNENQKKGKKGPTIHIPTPAEIKTYIMIAQNKLTLFRNKKIDAIRKKKQEIAKSLRENNLDVAKAKMDSLIREEDYITCYDILGPLLEILKERVTYIVTSTECPPDLRAQLDTVIYASTRLEFDELYKLRDLIMRKYGSAYISKAESNADKLVNINLVEKLRIKPASDAFVTIRLKQLCKEQKIPFEFPCEINSDVPGDIGNPFDNQGVNPYGGNNFNPYGPSQGGNPYGPPNNNGFNPYGPPNNNNPYGPPGGNYNNPYGPPGGNNNNPYGPPGGHNNNPYGPPGGNNNNPYGPPGGNNNNPYGPSGGNNGPQGGNNNNPFGPQGGNNNNPYGQPPSNNSQKRGFGGNNNQFGNNNNNNQFGNNNNNNQFGNNNNNQFGNNNNQFDNNNNPYGNNNNPYGNQNEQKNNNFGGDFNDYMNKQNNQNNDQNPFADNQTNNTLPSAKVEDSKLVDKSNLEDPFTQNPPESIIHNQNDNPYGNNNEDNDNPFASQNKANNNNSSLNDPFNHIDNDPFSKGTVISYNQNQPKADDNQNPYGDSSNNKNDNPFASKNNAENPYSGSDNPYSGGDDFPKTDDDNFPKSDSNPYSDVPPSGNPYEGDKSVSDQMFVNPKVDSYNDVGNDHLPTLASQIKGDKDK